MSRKDEFVERSQATLSLVELCELCELPPESVYEFVSYEIIHPQGATRKEWVFEVAELYRVKRAIRLQRDLEMSLHNVALVLELIEELEQLRTRAAVWEKHLLK